MAEAKKNVVRRKKAAERKDETIRLRVTTEQRKAYEAAAKASDLDVSSWLRMLARKAADAIGA